MIRQDEQARVAIVQDKIADYRTAVYEELASTIGVLALAMSASLPANIKLTQIRHATRRKLWFRKRIACSLAEPTVAGAVGVIIGAPGVAAGSAVHQLALLRAFRAFAPKGKQSTRRPEGTG